MGDKKPLFEITRPSPDKPRIKMAAQYRVTVMSVREAELLAGELMRIASGQQSSAAVFGAKPAEPQ